MKTKYKRRFTVFNRERIETTCPKYEHHLISIHTPSDPPPILPECDTRRDILTLAISDINFIPKDDMLYNSIECSQKNVKIVVFNEEHAYKILCFVKERFKSDIDFVIHCDAGISRSPGTAAALSKIYLDSDEFYFKNYLPNSLIYTTILKVYYDKFYYSGLSEKYSWMFK